MAKTGNLEMIKRVNSALVLKLIREKQPITRAKVAQIANLSRSTVSQIVEELIRKKFVTELGLSSSTSEGGRRGMKLGFNSRSAYGVGVDIAGSKCLVVVADLDGNVVFEESHPVPRQIPQIIELLQQSIERSRVGTDEIIGMGVGLPGTIDVDRGILMNDSPALGFKNIHLKQQFQPAFPFPLFFNNDVNCAAFGEKTYGSGGNANHLVFISIGTGIGSAVISNGTLLTGHRYSVGEIGYFVTADEVRDQVENNAEKFGTLEKKLSGTAIANKGYSIDIFKHYFQGNPESIAIVDELLIHLTVVIANIVSLLNPEKVILGGEISELLSPFLESIKKRVSMATPIETSIELAQLGQKAGAIGAIAYAFQQIQENE